MFTDQGLQGIILGIDRGFQLVFKKNIFPLVEEFMEKIVHV
jgi:hypothetical protein